jgi:hypothetical protein
MPTEVFRLIYTAENEAMFVEYHENRHESIYHCRVYACLEFTGIRKPTVD